MLVEFVGGPLDGERRIIPEDLGRAERLTFPMLTRLAPEASHAAVVRLREGVYVRSRVPGYFEWAGETDPR